MIIIEGPDNSGKSTLAKYLGWQLDMPVKHMGGPPKNSPEINNRVQFIFENKDQYIFDRMPLISEPIYCILRNGFNLFQGREDLYQEFRSYNPLIVYCRPSLNIILNHDTHKIKSHDNPEYLSKLENNATQIVNRYDEIMTSEFLPQNIVRYDYTDNNAASMEEYIVNEIIRLGYNKSKKPRPNVESSL